jgi:uncharacterized protein (TIGR02996 family)
MEDAFLQTILENPDDDTPRLVFADWLEEQGNPRGTFIRLQCQRAMMTQYDAGWKETLAQEAALLRQFEPDWSKPVLRLVDEVHYRRGFIEHVRVSATKLLNNAARLFRVAPICSIRMSRVDRLPEVAAAPWLARVRELDLSHNSLGSRSLQALLESEHCRSLRLLRLDHCGLAMSSVRVVAGSASLQGLQSLSVSSNGLGVEGVGTLASSPNLSGLRELDLHDNHLLAAGGVALGAAVHFQLTKLSIGNNALRSGGVQAIAGSPLCSALRYLDLQNNFVNNIGVQALVESPYLRRLECLNLYRNEVGSRGVQLLTDSALLANLIYLNLRNNEIDKPTLQTVPVRLQTANMRELLF